MKNFSSKALTNASIYELKSAMHIPLLVLGITPSSVHFTSHLSKQLKQYEDHEIEFFSDYTSFLDKTERMPDPLFEYRDEDDLAESCLPTRQTLLGYAAGVEKSSTSALKQYWTHYFAHKAQK